MNSNKCCEKCRVKLSGNISTPVWGCISISCPCHLPPESKEEEVCGFCKNIIEEGKKILGIPCCSHCCLDFLTRNAQKYRNILKEKTKESKEEVSKCCKECIEYDTSYTRSRCSLSSCPCHSPVLGEEKKVCNGEPCHCFDDKLNLSPQEPMEELVAIASLIKQAEERVSWDKEIDLAKTIDFYVAKERERIMEELRKLKDKDLGWGKTMVNLEDIIRLINQNNE